MQSSREQPLVVGIALKKEKRKKHISDKLVAKAAEAGITIRFVDKERELEAQGPFVAILQKVRKPEWEQALVRYAAAHPEVKVFDIPAATYPMRNRGTMVSFLDGGGWQFEEPPELVEPGRPPQRCRCNVPTNTTLAEGTSFEAALRQMQRAGLRFPVLAKPLWADGREGSHAMAVVHTRRGLERLVAGQTAYLQLPIMLQQYVDHGGCLFKVYVMGDTSVRVKRSSLHLPAWALRQAAQQEAAAGGGGAAAGAAEDAGTVQQQGEQEERAQAEAMAAAAAVAATRPAAGTQQQEEEQAGGPGRAPCDLPDLELMERVSAYPASKSWGRADTAPQGHGVPSPPAWLLQALAQRLRRKTGLNLFNFDVIVPMHLHRRRMAHEQSSGHLSRDAAAAAAAAAVAAAAEPANGSAGASPAAGAAVPGPAGSEAPLPSAGAAAEPAEWGLEEEQQQEVEEEEPAAIDLGAAAAAAAEAAAAAAEANGAAPDSARRLVAAAQQQPPNGAVAAAGPAAQQGQGQQEGQDPQSNELLYHLIDINYFPGYEKMPNYEDYMMQFLRSICFPSTSAGQQAGAQEDGQQAQQPRQQQQTAGEQAAPASQQGQGQNAAAATAAAQ